MSERKPVIKNQDMSEELKNEAIEVATKALEKHNVEKDIAGYIKKGTFSFLFKFLEFDKRHNPTWF
jgi:dynein light chain LC8-type